MTVKTVPGFATRALVEAVTAEAGAGDEPGRRVQVSFSSEVRYKRHDWKTGEPFWEVLGHNPSEPDLARLNSGAAPLLKDHMPTLDSAIGVVERAWVEDGRGHAVVRFSESAAADDVLARVRAGDVTCVSVGYEITRAIRAGEWEGIPVVRVVGWCPREISFVAIPADPSVGYGRSQETAASVVIRTEPDPDSQSREDENMTTPTTVPAAVTDAAAADAQRAAIAAATTDALSAERNRVREIDAIAGQFSVDPAQVRKAVDTGLTVDAFRAQVMDGLASANAESARLRGGTLGMSDKEVRSYSIMNVVRYLANPSDATRKAVGLEIEASHAMADKLGRAAGGIFLPTDVLMDSNYLRAQSAGTANLGGNLIEKELHTGSFIDLLRNRMALADAGVTIMQGLHGNVDIPKQTGAATMSWVAEAGAPALTDPTWGLVSMTPKTAAAATAITRRMLIQSSPDIEAFVRNDLLQVMAVGLDYTGLAAPAAANTPTSLRTAILGAKATFTGAYPTRDEIVDLETAVAAANADLGSLAYIYSATTSGALKKAKVDVGSGVFVEEDGEVNGYRRIRSNQVADKEVYFGNWRDLIIGMWSGIDLRVDTATLATSDGKVLRAFADVDVAVRNLQSFKLGTGI